MTSRERVNRTLERRETDRIPRHDSFWDETLVKWRAQGLPAEANVQDLFDFDIRGAGWVNYAAHIGREDVLEETAEWRLVRDGHGALLRWWKHKSGTPEHVGFTVDCRERWEEHKRTLKAVPVERRVNVEPVLREMERARREDRWFCWQGVECFEMAKDILGHETICVGAAQDPDWIRDVFETLTDVALSALDALERAGVRYDGGWIYGDIAYNHGPFLSPAMYRSLVQDCHRRHIEWFHSRGLKVIFHTDGDFRPLIPGLLDAGVDCFQPLEAKANVDVRELKPMYGDRVAFMGNIDVMVLGTNNKDLIEAEVAAKIPAAKEGGGYIYHSDHSVPPGVDWDTYCFLMESVGRHGRFDGGAG
jgi:uroporphyrinogen decarboxylase